MAVLATVLIALLGVASEASSSTLVGACIYAYDGGSQLSAPTAALPTGTTLADARFSERAAKVATRSRAGAATGFAAEDATPLIKAGSSGGETAGKAFPQSIRQQALDENPSTCVYCHMETDSPQVDHVIPRVQGGNATLENAQTTCGWCNASKGARDFPVNPPPGYEGAWPPEWWGLFGLEP